MTVDKERGVVGTVMMGWMGSGKIWVGTRLGIGCIVVGVFVSLFCFLLIFIVCWHRLMTSAVRSYGHCVLRFGR